MMAYVLRFTFYNTRLAPGDQLAVGAIVLAYVVGMALMPPVRDFALLDDWAYTQLAEGVANGQGLAPSQYAQATLVSHAYWGAAFMLLVGDTFTGLTLATMALSLVGALAFYAILRVLGFSAGLSGLGVAILTLNPFYLYLSYTFMTEVTFTALMLVACLCYLLGVRDQGSGIRGRGSVDGENTKRETRNASELLSTVYRPPSTVYHLPPIAWLALGGLFAALAFLTRQFGLALPVAALVWLVLARRLTAGRAVAVALLPLLAAVGYYAWSSGFGPTFSGSVGREELLELLHPGEWAQRGSRFVYFALFLPGLTVPLWSRPRRWRIGLAVAMAVGVIAFGLWQIKLRLASEGQSSLDELSFTWLRPVFGDGIAITLVYSLGAALSAWLLFGMAERAWPTITGMVKRRMEAPPALLFFMVGLILFAGTYLVSAGFLDRYWVPILPFVIAGALYGVRGRTMRSMVPVILALAVVGVYGACVRLDDYAQMEARWDAGRDLVASGVPLEKIENGYAWDGYFLYEEAIKRYPNPDVRIIGRVYPPYELIDPQYVIDNRTRPGYREVESVRYFSILDGMRSHDMLVLVRE
jgi:4-amino-4-deoxy-L-arabinose transferase-like glycosyltransferase